MAEPSPPPPLLSIRVIYEDLPDLIEVETRVNAGPWSGVATAYTGPEMLRDAARGLQTWAQRPTGVFVLEAGADIGIGWLRLRCSSVGGRGAIPCQVDLATSSGDPLTAWRLSLVSPVEAWSLEGFARQLERLAETLEGEAILAGEAGSPH